MPELCRLGGIVIKMYAGDHDPPLVHADHLENETQMSCRAA